MAKREIKIEFEFVSAKANGDNYKLCAVVNAENETSALNLGRIVGFKEFGAKFTENCIDWKIKQ